MSGQPRVVLMKRWRLHPWQQVHILAGNLDACRWATERFRGPPPLGERPVMRRFTAYRQNPPEGYVEGGYANPPDEPQFEGVVFTDGTVCVRWLTEHRSHSVWSSFDEMMAVHGHPEYGSRIEWADQ